MTQSSTDLASYMAESIPVSRWKLYRLKLLLFFFLMTFGPMLATTNAGAMLFEHPARVIVPGLLGSLALAVHTYWGERYERRYPWANVVLWLVLLAVALAVAWYGIEKHRHAIALDSTYTTTHP